MKNVQLSIDKVAIEYHGVTVNFYNQSRIVISAGKKKAKVMPSVEIMIKKPNG